MPITIYDNNPDRRRAMDNMHLVKFHDHFFEEPLNETTAAKKDFCMQFADQFNYKDCGTLIP